MWSKVNASESWWTRKTGREYGFENQAARVRRMARDASIPTDKVDVPSASRGRGLPTKDQIRAAERAEERAAAKEVKQLQGLLTRLDRQLRAEQAILTRVEKTGNAGAIRRAQKAVDEKEREIEEIGKQLGRRKR